jgi:hypothetical protein
MTPDSILSLVFLGWFLMVVTNRRFCLNSLEALLKLTRPGATVLLLSGVAFLYMKKFHYSALVLALVSVYLLKDLWTHYVRSDARRLYLEQDRDQARFDPLNSIDLQMANGSVVHGAPRLLSASTNPPMLVFPPSDETLRQMSG